MPFHRFQFFLFEEAFETAFRVATLLANHACGSSLRRFWNQPIKIRRIVRNKPDASSVRGTILREPDNGLYQRNGFDGRPAGGTRQAACCAVCADNAIGVQLFALAARLDFQAQASLIPADVQETRIKRKRSSRLLNLLREGSNQPGALDNQVRLLQSNLRAAAVGKEFKTANSVDDAALCRGRHLTAEMIGNNQRARSGFEMRLGFQHADGPTAPSDMRSREEPGSRGSYNDNFPRVAAIRRPGFAFFHSPVRPQWCAASQHSLPGRSTQKIGLLPAQPARDLQNGWEGRCKYTETACRGK